MLQKVQDALMEREKSADFFRILRTFLINSNYTFLTSVFV